KRARDPPQKQAAEKYRQREAMVPPRSERGGQLRQTRRFGSEPTRHGSTLTRAQKPLKRGEAETCVFHRNFITRAVSASAIQADQCAIQAVTIALSSPGGAKGRRAILFFCTHCFAPAA